MKIKWDIKHYTEKSQSGGLHNIIPIEVTLAPRMKTVAWIVRNDLGQTVKHSQGAWLFPTSELAIKQIRKWR